MVWTRRKKETFIQTSRKVETGRWVERTRSKVAAGNQARQWLME